MVNATWITKALDALRALKVEHRNYKKVTRRIASSCKAMFRGELLVLVGPPRVGKTRCVREALGIPQDPVPDDDELMRVVIVEAGNESTSGEFSTKGFAMACLRAIRHPVYGVAADDDPWEQKLDELLDRTPERRLWSAFQRALIRRKTEYLIIDEAHHVSYVRGGPDAAARVLDSWKCLANTTKVKLVLTGSYDLLSLLRLATHLLGRQQPLEFARYRSDSRADIEAWEQLLRRFSELLRFQGAESLSSWNRMLFEGSMGRAGGLSLWIRTALAVMEAEGLTSMTLEILEATRLPALQEAAILQEIVEGERNMLRFRATNSSAASARGTEGKNDGHVDLQMATQEKTASSKVKRKTVPFRRKPKRNAVNGRA